MKKPTLGLAVIYAGGNVLAAVQAAEKAGAPLAMDDLMASRLSAQRPYPATITRVIDDETVDLELIGIPADQPRQRFAVKFGATGEAGTWNYQEVPSSNGAPTPPAPGDDLESMTVPQLRELAASRTPPVEIPSDAKKADIIAALQAAK